MNVYLVGGAVRDRLLDIPVQEKDWVVVGATPEELLHKKYRQVGRNFPVFLHPETKEEYALARKEKKSAPGYYGFTCDFSPHVTLQEDLSRRDLTINAMAMNEKGEIIDPYQGQLDIKNKILRHVSPAFVEDPVRVLRVARFAARFHHLGFKLANQTRSLMYAMVKEGELMHLVAERVWQELESALKEKNPEQFVWVLRSCGALKIVFPELDCLFGIPNPSQYHPEIDSGIHSLMTLQKATNLTQNPMVRFAALVHDLGKALSPMNHWPKHHGHEVKGTSLVKSMCSRLKIPNDYKKLALAVCLHHLTIHRLLELNAKTIVTLLEQLDAFKHPQFFYEVLTACQADAQGRGSIVAYPQLSKWQYILSECNKLNSKILVQQGYEGRAIKEELHLRRVVCVKFILNSWKSNEK